jgi:hypothetical protein
LREYNELAMSKTQLIIEIGAEGGSIKVLGRAADDGATEYSVKLRDQTMTFLSGDEAGPEIRRDSAWTESWDLALKTLGKWPWPMLYPMYVHPDYRERVLSEVERYRRPDGQPARASAVERWREACNPSAER